MANKRTPKPAAARRSGPAGNKSRRPKRKNSRPKRKKNSPQLSWQLFKAALGLIILMLLVVCAGVMAHHLLLRAPYGRLNPPTTPPKIGKSPSQTGPRSAAQDATASKNGEAKEPVRFKVPTYEIFNPNTTQDRAPEPAKPSPDRQRPLVAIIVDDLGYDLNLAKCFIEMDGPFTFSMLPQGPFTRKIVAEAHARGHEIMLHLPMEPLEYPQVSPGPGALLVEMTPDELLAQLDADLMAIPHLKGVNNHMGSRLSAQAPQMRQIFSRLKARGLYYVDSRTTKETVGRPAAERLHLPFAERDIFIDHYQDVDFIRKQLRQLVKRAHAQGVAIGIAHPHPLTIELMRSALPELKDQVTLVPASRVVAEAG
jgi:polysaccharide deacetylase 2 family uncharacterized protein YibQ